MKVGELTQQFPAIIPLALVLKQFLADRSLDDSYSGGLSSYCLVSDFLAEVMMISKQDRYGMGMIGWFNILD